MCSTLDGDAQALDQERGETEPAIALGFHRRVHREAEVIDDTEYADQTHRNTPLLEVDGVGEQGWIDVELSDLMRSLSLLMDRTLHTGKNLANVHSLSFFIVFRSFIDETKYLHEWRFSQFDVMEFV